MRLSELIDGGLNGNVEITGVFADSREVHSGGLFICINGEKSDGHNYAALAVKNGAVAVLAERVPDYGETRGVTTIICDNTRLAAAKIFSAFYGAPQKKLRIFGITGTNGKSTTAALLAAMLRAGGRKTAISGTVCTEWDGFSSLSQNTTELPERLYPMMAHMVSDGVTDLVAEVSSHALALGRVCGIDFHCGIYTNLTPEHLDFHGSVEEYAAAKSLLFSQCYTGVFNCDDISCRAEYNARQGSGCRRYSCGIHGRYDYTAENIRNNGMHGSSFDVVSDGVPLAITTSLIGEFNIYNILTAAAAALEAGIPPEAVNEAVRSFGGVPGRTEIIYDGTFTVMIDFAHTPDALERMLMSVRACSGGRKLTVLFGCGGDRDRSKRPRMGAIACGLADSVIITSDNSRSENPKAIIDDILAGVSGDRHTVIQNRRYALEYMIDNARDGEIYIVAGKGHENYEIDRTGKHLFCEKEIILGRIEHNINQSGDSVGAE